MLKAAILSTALLTVMAGAAVAPGLAQIAEYFENAAAVQIKLILTLPALFIIATSLITDRLTKFLSKKKLMSIGLLMYLIGGAGGAFAESIYTLLAFRALLGVSVGIVMPLSVSYIADFFEGEERAHMMGLSAAASNLGGAFATLLAGYLAVYSWRMPFAVYSASLIVLIMVIFFIPQDDKTLIPETKSGRLPGGVYIWGGWAFALMVVFYAFPTNIAIYIHKNGYGDASVTGYLISIATATGFAAGMMFKRIRRALGRFLHPAVPFLITAAFLIFHYSTARWQMLIAVLCTGSSMGLAMPIINTGAASRAEGRNVKAMSLVTAMLFLGQFTSPIIIDSAAKVLGLADFRQQSAMLAALTGAIGAILLMRSVKMKISS